MYDMSDLPRIAQLIVQRVRGGISPADDQELEAWADYCPENRAFLETRVRSGATADNIKLIAEMDDRFLEREVWNKMQRRERRRKRREVIAWAIVTLLLSLIAIAASFLKISRG